MKKVFLLISAIIAFAHPVLAEDTTGVFMEIHKTGNEDIHTKINRSLIQEPTLDVVYDSDTKTIRITSMESLEATVYIYDSNGTIVGSANTLNTTIQLPSPGSYTIYIETEAWYAIGNI